MPFLFQTWVKCANPKSTSQLHGQAKGRGLPSVFPMISRLSPSMLSCTLTRPAT
jgi:hypothetical protein